MGGRVKEWRLGAKARGQAVWVWLAGPWVRWQAARAKERLGKAPAQRFHYDRPIKLLAVLVAVVGLPVWADWLLAHWEGLRVWLVSISHGPVVGALIYAPGARDAPVWKDRVGGFTLLVSAAVGYVLWHWRDVNARATIENARKDVNLKEFQEIQLRAAGALDREKLGEEACEQLQIAALHQLRGFLRGEYGAAFQRPAFELLLAGHAAAMERNGVPEAIRAWAEDEGAAKGDARAHLSNALKVARARLSAVDRERLGILRDEAAVVIGTGFPLNGRVLDLVEWSGLEARKVDFSGASLIGADLLGAHLEGADLRRAHLEGAALLSAHLEGAQLRAAHLEGADLREVHLEGANLKEAHLEGADLEDADLEGADLEDAHLEGADLRAAHLEGAQLWGANLEGATLMGAWFDDATRLLLGWQGLSPEQRAAHQQRLRDRGARHVDDAEQGEEG